MPFCCGLEIECPSKFVIRALVHTQTVRQRVWEHLVQCTPITQEKSGEDVTSQCLPLNLWIFQCCMYCGILRRERENKNCVQRILEVQITYGCRVNEWGCILQVPTACVHYQLPQKGKTWTCKSLHCYLETCTRCITISNEITNDFRSSQDTKALI